MQSSQNSTPPWKHESKTVIFSIEDLLIFDLKCSFVAHGYSGTPKLEGAGGARTALHENSFYLSYIAKGNPRRSRQFFKKLFLRESLQTSNFPWYNYEANIQNIALLEQSLEIKIYPPVEEHTYLSMCPERKPCPPCLRCAQTSLWLLIHNSLGILNVHKLEISKHAHVITQSTSVEAQLLRYCRFRPLFSSAKE